MAAVALTTKPTDGANAIHLHPKTSSPSNHGGSAAPPHLGLSLQEVKKELWDCHLLARQLPYCAVTCRWIPKE